MPRRQRRAVRSARPAATPNESAAASPDRTAPTGPAYRRRPPRPRATAHPSRPRRSGSRLPTDRGRRSAASAPAAPAPAARGGSRAGRPGPPRGRRRPPRASPPGCRAAAPRRASRAQGRGTGSTAPRAADGSRSRRTRLAPGSAPPAGRRLRRRQPERRSSTGVPRRIWNSSCPALYRLPHRDASARRHTVAQQESEEIPLGVQGCVSRPSMSSAAPRHWRPISQICRAPPPHATMVGATAPADGPMSTKRQGQETTTAGFHARVASRTGRCRRRGRARGPRRRPRTGPTGRDGAGPKAPRRRPRTGRTGRDGAGPKRKAPAGSARALR